MADNDDNKRRRLAHAAFGISRFIVCVSPNNTQSLALIARLGFAKIGDSRPDPDYLHPFARDAVEFGYYVVSDYRRHGYAATRK